MPNKPPQASTSQIITATSTDPKSNADTNPKERKRRVRHKKKEKDVEPAEDLDPWVCRPWLDFMDGQREYDSIEHKLHDEILAFSYQYAQLTPQEIRLRHEIFVLLERITKQRYYKSELGLFGSSVTGLGVPVSDLDITLSLPPEYITDPKVTLFQLSAAIKRSGITTDVRVNHRARVPIIKFTTGVEYGSLSVDININHPAGIINSIYIKNEILPRYPHLHPLSVVLKTFLAKKDLNDAAFGGVSSYAIVTMVLSWLQLNPPQPDASLGSLLSALLFYYAFTYPYTTSYISVSQSAVLSRDGVEWIKKKKEESERLVVQDILEPEIDITRALTRLPALKEAFKEGYTSLLQANLADTSILGTILGVRQSTLQHRAFIAHLVDSGELDNRLNLPGYPYQQRPRGTPYPPPSIPLRHQQQRLSERQPQGPSRAPPRVLSEQSSLKSLDVNGVSESRPRLLPSARSLLQQSLQKRSVRQ